MCYLAQDKNRMLWDKCRSGFFFPLLGKFNRFRKRLKRGFKSTIKKIFFLSSFIIIVCKLYAIVWIWVQILNIHLLYSMKRRKSYRFRTTWWWTNADCNINLTECYTGQNCRIIKRFYVFEGSLLCSPRLYLSNQKYSKKKVKYYCSLKELFSI